MSLLVQFLFGNGRQQRSGALLSALCAFMLVTAFSLFSPPLSAQTSVSGAISSDTHWTIGNSPYLITADTIIQNGAVLTIDAGVIVYMAADSGLSVQSGGIRAAGTAVSPVRVLSDKTRTGMQAAAGDWNQWVFNAGTVNTQLDYVLFEHGKGLAINGGAPILNYLDLRNHAGPAITLSLSASPAGVGNQASGNTLNGIAVPAGDVIGNVTWGLRGIPYVVEAGLVSVGASPTVTQTTPTTIERGQTIILSIDGTRLTGYTAGVFDRDGLTATPFSGASSTHLNLQVKADQTTVLGPTSLRLRVDAGDILVANALTVTLPLPAITTISPTSVDAGAGTQVIVVTGSNFTSQSEVLFNSASVQTQYIAASEMRATLANQSVTGVLPVQVRTPDPQSPGQYLVSNTINLTVQAPVPPTVAFEPSLIAIPPDSKPHTITLRLSKADIANRIISLSISDPAKATLSPSTVTILAGQTSATVTITPVALGSVTLTAQSPGIATLAVPLFITADFLGVNTSYAAPVGIVVEGSTSAGSVPVTVTHPFVGVSVGSTLTGVTPGGWAAGSTQTFTVTGNSIPAGAQITVVPSTGLTVGAVVVAPDGLSMSFAVTAAVDTAPGPRKFIVRDAVGAHLTFANPAQSAVILTTGVPEIDSISPIQTTQGSVVQLAVRGRNLQNARLKIAPGEGIEVDAQPVVDASGTQLTAIIAISSTASLGPKVIQVITPSSTTSSESSAANTLSIVSAIQANYTPIASSLVGVVVGDAAPPETQLIAPILSTQLGIVVGASVTEVLPKTGVIGTELTVTIKGQGLAGVTGVSLKPLTGVTLSEPSINAEGTQLTFNMQVDAAAAQGLRQLIFNTATGPLTFARATDGAFLITAPVPEIDSTAPQTILIGNPTTVVTLRGRNFTNISGVRLSPADGVTVNSPFVTSADGASLTFTLTSTTGATPGTRTVIVTSAAGDSSGIPVAGNTLQFAAQIGPTYSDITSGVVGIVVGDTTPTPVGYDGALIAPAVGVMVGEPATESVSTNAVAPAVGLLIGSAALNQSPAGWLRGASGNITVTGVGLDQVTSAVVLPTEGVLLSPMTVSGEGTLLTIPISVAPDAPLIKRRLRLRTATGEVVWINGNQALFGLGSLPTMTSISPIVLERGKGHTLSIRGSNLQGVVGVSFIAADGVMTSGVPVWSQDGLGELLTIRVTISDDASLGDRVLRLDVPGGSTTSAPSVTNTVKFVVQP